MLPIIPNPAECTELDGNFLLTEDVTIHFDPAFADIRNFFDSFLADALTHTNSASKDCHGNLTSEIRKGKNPGQQNCGKITFLLDNTIVKEGYKILCLPDSLTVSAKEPSGAFYAIQTLRQLTIDTPLLPCFEINDYPAYSFRGLSLDEARHFFGMEEVKRRLDLMALHKLNVFHWHLTDDQGWRIEIKQYPMLTKIGSYREDTNIHGWKSTDREGKPHSGFYTQEQIKEIVDYAAKRFITVVPEFDMPAHFMAAIASYPWLACREIPTEVPWYFGGLVPESQGITDWNRTACAGKQSTFDFIFDVLEEMLELFPSKLFHIGGDEAPRDEWKICPLCQKVIRENHLKDEEELQGWFNNKVKAWAGQKGLRLIGWNEILTADNLGRDIIAQYWTPGIDKNIVRHLSEGGEIIISCHEAFYFDMCYADVPLEATYHFTPADYDIPEKYYSQIIGIEGEVWTEWIADREKLDITSFPRVEALAEAVWTPQNRRNFDDFMIRLHHFEKLLDKLGVEYAADCIALKRSDKAQAEKEIEEWQLRNQYIDVENNRKIKSKN